MVRLGPTTAKGAGWYAALSPTPTSSAVVAGTMNGDFALTDIPELGIPAGDSWRQGYLYCAQSPADRKRWVSDWLACGIQDMWIAPTVRYGTPGSRPYATEVDCRQDPERFLACLEELRAAKIRPWVQIAQGETYGKYDHLDLDQFKRDMDSWPRWGWQQAVNLPGYGVNLWPEADDSLYPQQYIEIARVARDILPAVTRMAHVGRTGEGTYIGYGDDESSPDYYGPERFWKEMHAAGCWMLGWEAKTEIFEQPDGEWQRILVREYLGAYTRLTEILSAEECQRRANSVGVTLTPKDLQNMRTEGKPYDGGGTALPYYEGPEYGITWSTYQKAEAAALLIGVGAPGSMSGAVSVLSLWDA